MGWHDDELRAKLSAHVAEGLVSMGLDSEAVEKLGGLYPFLGDRIDWSKLPLHAHDMVENKRDPVDRFMSFFRAQAAEYNLEGPVLYAGDGGTSLAVTADMDSMPRSCRSS